PSRGPPAPASPAVGPPPPAPLLLPEPPFAAPPSTPPPSASGGGVVRSIMYSAGPEPCARNGVSGHASPCGIAWNCAAGIFTSSLPLKCHAVIEFGPCRGPTPAPSTMYTPADPSSGVTSLGAAGMSGPAGTGVSVASARCATSVSASNAQAPYTVGLVTCRLIAGEYGIAGGGHVKLFGAPCSSGLSPLPD